MKKLSLVVLLLAGCTAEPTSIDPLAEDGDDSAALDQPVAGKSDEIARCGTDSCERRLCGFKTPPGAVPTEACFPSDSRADAYVKLGVSGSDSLSVDSRTFGFHPVWRIDNALFFGTDLWRFSAERNGLAIQYHDIINGAFLAGDPYQYGPDAEVYIRDFKGPGTYTAEGVFSRARSFDGQNRAGTRYTTADGCQVTITAGSPDGIKGTFRCTLTAKDSGGSVSMTGEFQSGATALDGPIIVSK